MAELEARLAQAVGRRAGLRRRRSPARRSPPAASACGRCSASSRRPSATSELLLAAGVATELVHMATLVHDDLVDGARMRRGVPAAWSVFGPGAALSAGDYLFACAFAELAATADSDAVAILADACLALARGEALQRVQTREPETTIDAYLERCALKTGKLFEAACRLGSGGDPELGAYGLALGIAFQIADDILDCAGQTQETGKIPGTDLREGTPTMPLLLAAQQDDVVRRALAGGPLDGALVRVAAHRRARALPRGGARLRCEGPLVHRLRAHREELEALTYAVVDRAS